LIIRLLNRLNTYFRKKALFYSAVIIFLPILFRFFELQVIDYNKYKKLAGNNSLRAIEIKAPRGIIYDRDSIPLVDNIYNYNFEIMPIDIIDKRSKEIYQKFNFALIDSIIGINKNELTKKIYSRNKGIEKFHPFIAKRFVDFNDMVMLKEHIIDLPGVIFSEIPARTHVSDVNLSHVLGYVRLVDNERKIKLNKQDTLFQYSYGDVYGFSGLEKSYESYLRGANGAQYRLIDYRGVDQGVFNNKDGRDVINGPSLITSIDINLQRIAENFLKDSVGAIICMDPTNGEILAFASSPDFDLKPFNKGPVPQDIWDTWNSDPNNPLLNRPISGQYPPGSVFKLVTASLILKSGKEEVKYKCDGEYQITKDVVKKCWNTEGHGELNLKDALINSCNVYFYEAVEKLSFDELVQISKEFNFGDLVGIDLPNEKKGLIPTRKYMNKKYRYRDELGVLHTNWAVGGAKANMSIGQGEVLATPLQVVNLINFIANKGYIYSPHLIKNKDNVIRKDIELSPWIWTFLDNAIYNAVKEGTGKNADILNSDAIVRGKTGTAQNPQGEDHSWFAGYVTSKKTLKKMSLVVLVENGGSGAGVASNMAHDFFEYFIDNQD
tara:strand:- start:25797 stop:27617 length:1821 start_codon:yes stop_codon:yes gene_type:complete